VPLATQAIPPTFEQAATTLAAASSAGRTVRIRGAGTKLGWGWPIEPVDMELCTTGLNRIVEHNVGDLTAILEAGVPLAMAQRRFETAGQMLALDPPLGAASGATVGGVAATGDSGPMRHRYGAPRDLIVGATVALSDGSIAKSGGKVIKNVAGYDLAKLFAGSFGTLGVILSLSVRLHPLPGGTTTAIAAASDPDLLAAAAHALSASPLEFEALDIAWRAGRGGILARCGGPEHARRATRAARELDDLGLEGVEVIADDDVLWERQRSGQRSADGAIVRIAAPRGSLPAVLRAADECGGTLVGRAALGVSYVELEPDAIAQLRAALATARSATVLDAAVGARSEHDPWGPLAAPELELMRKVKARFDPTGTCNPGLFVGGI
jgi:glycolate oxidase FAD binding subunit